jgi:SNF2 family DNA or RNA helicase
LLLGIGAQKDQCKQERDAQFAKLALATEYDTITSIATTDLERISAKRAQELGNEIVRTCGKLQVLQSLFPVWRERQSKVLLFSKSTQMLTILEKWLTLQRYSYLRFDGSIAVGPKRQRIIDQVRVAANHRSVSSGSILTVCSLHHSSPTMHPYSCC